MSQTSRNNQTQKAMTGDKKGFDTFSDILMAHRTGRLPKEVYFKDDRGETRIDYDKADKARFDR